MSQPMSQPPIHIRAVITWMAIFPLVTIGSLVIAPFANDWNPVLRAFVLSTFVVPLAVYFVVPQLTRAYAKLRRSWTHGKQTPKGGATSGIGHAKVAPPTAAGPRPVVGRPYARWGADSRAPWSSRNGGYSSRRSDV